jgi:2-oxoglutarate dehydrogenase E2 component (dihydrolipoamide succinyltransferase)
MTIDIKVPSLGESVTEATVGRWFKNAGEAVVADEPLVELETEKVTVEVPAPAAGTLVSVSVAQGATVAVGSVLGAILEGAGAAQGGARDKTSDQTRDQTRTTRDQIGDQIGDQTGDHAGDQAGDRPRDEARKPARPAGGRVPPPASHPGGGPARSAAAPPPSPAARKIMEEKGVALADVEGTGRRGQILKSDVAGLEGPVGGAAKAAPPVPFQQLRAPTAPNDAVREERVPMSRLRQTIARRLKEAQNTAAMLTTFNDVDMGAIMGIRATYKEMFEQRHGVKLGFMSFFVKASIQALREIPAVNAEIDAQDIIYKNYYHIGVAVGTERGLVVPVVREADRMSLAEIEQTIADFSRRAHEGRLTIEEMQGGTFTISNGGVYGSLLSTPILNAPQSGVLGMHRIDERPVVRGGQVVVRPMMNLALTYDHRIVDGRDAVRFLVRVKECLEDPQRFLLEL